MRGLFDKFKIYIISKIIKNKSFIKLGKTKNIYIYTYIFIYLLLN